MKKSKLTGREVIMVVFLVVLLVGVCYYLLFLTPLKKDIADINIQISEAESQLSVSQAQVASMDKRQAELDEILSRPKDEITEIAPYDNAKQLMLDAGLEVCTLSDEAKATMQELALEEIEKLSEANDACGQIYEQLLLYLKYKNEFAWN